MIDDRDISYVNWLHAVAEQLGCEPEDIEGREAVTLHRAGVSPKEAADIILHGGTG